MIKVLTEINEDIIRLAESCNYEQAHTVQVTYLAGRLFEETRELHGLPDTNRHLLLAAAMLHDIGWVRGGKGHHKTAYEIITKKRPDSIGAAEVEIIAQVARYHRKALPALKHAPFARLSITDRMLVCKLASLLRIADGLDRGHQASVRDVHCEISPGKVVLYLEAVGSAELEIWGAKRKADLFEDTFDISLDIKAR